MQASNTLKDTLHYVGHSPTVIQPLSVGNHGGEERMSLQNLVPNRAHPRIEGGAEDLTHHAL